MVEFGRSCLNAGDWPSRVPFILADAHIFLLERRGDSYLAEPGVWADLTQVYQGYLQRYPNSDWDRSFYTYLACRAERWDVAAEQFATLGDRVDPGPFKVEGDVGYFQRKAGKWAADRAAAAPKGE
jgi:hypothetical protein